MADTNHTPSKACTRCGVTKPATPEYYGKGLGRLGCNSRCKKCLCELAKERNKDPAVKAYRKQYKREQYRANPEKFRAQKRDWVKRNPEKIAAQKRREYSKNAESQKQKALEWQRANPERARARKRAYKKSEKGRANASKPANRLRANCSLSIRRFLRGQKANKPWTSMVDYTMAELIAHLERQFTKGMSWDNYGEWHLDHILPLASFNIAGPESEDFKRAFSLANLRPLWGAENQAKSAKIVTLL